MEEPMALKLGELIRGRPVDPRADNELTGLLEPGIELEGKLAVMSGMVRINTHIKGEVECAGVVVLDDHGDVEGLIRTRFISVAGKVKGTIHAAAKVEIKTNGIVLGDIHTPSLLIEPGGYFDGQCNMPDPVPADTYEKTKEAKRKV